jgi:hypothetical protein
MSTSTEALRYVSLTGKRDAHKKAVWDALVANPGEIASDLARIAGYDPVETRRRLTDLKIAGKAYPKDSGYGPSGRREMRWWPQMTQKVLL